MSIRTTTIALLLLLSGICSVSIAADGELKSMEQKFSYTLGYILGQQMLKQVEGVDKAAVIAAIEDVFAKKEPKLSHDDMNAILAAVTNKRKKIAGEQASKNMEMGKKFLEENKKKKGVVVLPGGIQYLEMVKGEGASPEKNSSVIVNYTGTHINGTVFDSSRRHGGPASFNLGRVIPGFRDAISKMQKGSKWQIFIPPEQAYGKAGSPPAIKPNETLIFEIELVSFGDAEQAKGASK